MIQLKDYNKYIEDNTYAQFLGLGIGAPYYSEVRDEDKGEVKIIDIESLSNFKYNIQTPIIALIKDVGPIVFLIILLFNYYTLFVVIKRMRKIYRKKEGESREELLSGYLVVSFGILLVSMFSLQATLPFSAFYGFLFARIQNLEEKNKFKRLNR